MQGTRVPTLVQEDSTCEGETKPTHHNYWSPHALEPVLRNKRSQRNEKPVHCHEECLLTATREKPAHTNKDPMQPLKKLITIFKKKQWTLLYKNNSRVHQQMNRSAKCAISLW